MTDNTQEAVDSLGPLKYLDDSAAFAGSLYSSFIAKSMKALHSGIPPSAPPDFRKPAHIEIRSDYFRGRNVRRAVVFLLSNGCEWALNSAHGCTMCGHLAKQGRTDQPISADQFINQFTAALSSINLDEVPVLNIYNNGSFFNSNEIPSEARRAILRTISEHRSIKKVLVECRPEFITDAVLHETKAIMQETELEIAIGLETSDDFRRIVAINKGFMLRDFARAAEIVRSNNIGLRSYILLKPPFCAESDAIVDSIRSIETAFAFGTKTVSLEAMTIQKYTLIDYLFRSGIYEVPWLWSIVEVVRRTAHLGMVVIGLFQFYPSPDFVPNNCTLCNGRVMDAIVEYNRTLRVDVFDGLDCECKAEWFEVLKEGTSWYQRLENFVTAAMSEGLVRVEGR